MENSGFTSFCSFLWIEKKNLRLLLLPFFWTIWLWALWYLISLMKKVLDSLHEQLLEKYERVRSLNTAENAGFPCVVSFPNHWLSCCFLKWHRCMPQFSSSTQPGKKHAKGLELRAGCIPLELHLYEQKCQDSSNYGSSVDRWASKCSHW